MFDQNTINLISSAPDFEKIGLHNLSNELTKVYTQIISDRKILQQSDKPEEINKIINRMKKIALTYEGLLAVQPERSNTESIAFIAASAHHLAFLAQQILNNSNIDTKLATHMISSDISATLLFVISGYMSDAKNLANLISISYDDQSVKSILLKAIVELIHGDLTSILEQDLNEIHLNEDTLAAQVTNALYLMLLQGIQLLAHELLGQHIGDALESFQRTYDLCSENLDIENHNYMSIYAGPRYLAALLKLVTTNLISRATIQINNFQHNHCDTHLLKKLAQNTPFLSKNDQSAVNTGYLNSQVSSVIHSTIGMDYYSILSLKIISTWSKTKKKTLVLVENQYHLYESTKKLKNIFGDNQIQGHPNNLPIQEEIIAIVVTTQGLTELLKNPNFTQLNIGLFAIEECAILGNTFNKTEVSIEPMFALLSLLDKYPTVMMLLLTYKIQNIQEVAEWIQNITKNTCLSISLEHKPARQAKGIVVYNGEELNKNNGKNVQPLGLFTLKQNWVDDISSHSIVGLSDKPISLPRGTNDFNPNKYQVSALIAEYLAIPECKVIIFTDNISSSMSKLTNQIEKDIFLNEEENRLYLQCIDELGDAKNLYLQIDEYGHVLSSGVCDFNLLLPIERSLYRSLFQRKDGIDLLITSIWGTSFKYLSYNVAVITGHQQFDLSNKRNVSYNKQELLEQIHHVGIHSHSSSCGLSIIVPSDIIRIQNKHIPYEIKNIYSNDEYESELYDPLTNILDKLTLQQSLDEYGLPLVRLVHSEIISSDNTQLINHIVNKSYFAYKKDPDWINKQIHQLSTWQEEYSKFSVENIFADSLNIRSSLLSHIESELQKIKDLSVMEWHNFIFTQLLHNCSELREYFLHLLSKSYRKEKDDEKIPTIEDIEILITLWLMGCSVKEIEGRITKPKGAHNRNLLWYRKLLFKCLPEFLQITDLIKKVYEHMYNTSTLSLQCLSDCSKYGFDRYEKLILYQMLDEKINRREIHRLFDQLDISKSIASYNETYQDAYNRVNSSYVRLMTR